MNVDLSNAHFTHGIFENVIFIDTNIEEADFRHARFTETDIEKAKNIEKANFYSATIDEQPISQKFPALSCKKKYDNLKFSLVTIIGGLVMGGLFGGFSYKDLEEFDVLQFLFVSTGLVLGMFLGAPLYTFVGDCWGFCCRIAPSFKHLNSQYPLLFLLVIICALVLLFAIGIYWHTDDILMNREEYYANWNPPPEKKS